MPDSTDTTDQGGDLGLDATTRKCPACGESYSGDSHKGCTNLGITVKKSPSSKSRLDELPAEAIPLDTDASRQLNQYILVKQIGKGGMGAVWKAWDRKLTRWVAIKFLLAADEEDIQRFQREAKLAARLRHPNIAPIYEVGEAPAMRAGEQTRHYLAMEFIDGQSLAAVQLPLRELADIFMKIAQGIDAAHKGGVVHRDLKPQNIMLTSDKWPYVMDFGLAKALQMESSISVSGAILGTPAYMPPEQAQGALDAIDAQSDIYSLGATMYAVLCRKAPFTGQTPMEVLMKVCKDRPAPPRQHNPEIPVEIETIILKAMAKDKAGRYKTAAAFAEDLKRYLSDQEIEARRPSTVRLMAGQAKRNVWPFVLALSLLAGGVSVYFVTRKKPSSTGGIEPSRAAESDARRVAEWRRIWREERKSISYYDFQTERPSRGAEIHAHLQQLPPTEADEVKAWFEGEIGDADHDAQAWTRKPRTEWLAHRESAARVVEWCAALDVVLEGIDPIRTLAARVAAVRQAAQPVAAYQGAFRLRVFVMGASVSAIRCGGRPVPLPEDTDCPFVLDLEVADYEVEVTHPKDGSNAAKLSDVKNGKTVTLVGRIKSLRAVSD